MVADDGLFTMLARLGAFTNVVLTLGLKGFTFGGYSHTYLGIIQHFGFGQIRFITQHSLTDIELELVTTSRNHNFCQYFAENTEKL